jgi:hypothetical protein
LLVRYGDARGRLIAFEFVPAGNGLPVTQPPQTSTPVASSTGNTPGISGASPSPSLASGAKISLAIDNTDVREGDSFRVDININSDSPVRGAQWKLNFDPQAMQLQKIDEGNFFKDWAKANNGTTLIFPKPEIDNEKGQVSDMGIAVMSSAEGGAKGSGNLCSYYFNALSGLSEIPVISEILLCDTAGNTFPYADTAVSK